MYVHCQVLISWIQYQGSHTPTHVYVQTAEN